MTTPGGDALPPAQAAKNRALITLVLDTSDSMARDIGRLNDALAQWRQGLAGMNQVRRMGEIAMVTFGRDGVKTLDPTGRFAGQPVQAFVSVSDFNPPPLQHGGYSPMVEAINEALILTDRRVAELRDSGIGLACRPMAFLVTDGVPTELNSPDRTERWRDLAAELHRRTERNVLVFYAFGVPGADAEVLRGLAGDNFQTLDRVDFPRILRQVSDSIQKNLQSREPTKTLLADEERRKAVLEFLRDPNA